MSGVSLAKMSFSCAFFTWQLASMRYRRVFSLPRLIKLWVEGSIGMLSAQWAVKPLRFSIVGLALAFSTKYRAASRSPFSVAKNNAVHPRSSCASTSAPISTRYRLTSASRANISAVCPSLLRMLMLAWASSTKYRATIKEVLPLLPLLLFMLVADRLLSSVLPSSCSFCISELPFFPSCRISFCGQFSAFLSFFPSSSIVVSASTFLFSTTSSPLLPDFP
mmetsp:Transcript_14013/g.23522  ORF Transcript_14013/g.23522 Transcript_14013/m.23522 type:complete len:221 (-) Transcript_14013:382-1044(-)